MLLCGVNRSFLNFSWQTTTVLTTNIWQELWLKLSVILTNTIGCCLVSGLHSVTSIRLCDLCFTMKVF